MILQLQDTADRLEKRLSEEPKPDSRVSRSHFFLRCHFV